MEKRENIAVLKRISLSYMMVERKKTNVSRGKKMIAKKKKQDGYIVVKRIVSKEDNGWQATYRIFHCIWLTPNLGLADVV